MINYKLNYDLFHTRRYGPMPIATQNFNSMVYHDNVTQHGMCSRRSFELQSKILTYDGESNYTVMNNVCAHKHATLRTHTDPVCSSHVECPLHKWKFDFEGNNVLSSTIKTLKLTKFNQLLLEENNPFITKPLAMYSNYEFVDYVVDKCNHDWKIYVELFLDLYHVKHIHSSLSTLSGTSNFDWEFPDSRTVIQYAYWPKSWNVKDKYGMMINAFLRHHAPKKYACVWIGIFPNVMIEILPGGFVVSTVHSLPDNKCLNSLAFYSDPLLGKQFGKLFMEAWLETAEEDKYYGDQIQENRRYLSGQGSVFNHPTLEAATEKFYRWLDYHTI